MIKLLYRIPIRLIQFLFINTGLVPLGMLLIPFGLLMRLNDKRTVECPDQRLPEVLSWFDVGDELDKKYGLNGDLGYQSTRKMSNKWEIFKSRYIWLALRNPLNGFKYNVLGVDKTHYGVYTKYKRSKGSHIITDWENGKAGWFYCEANLDDTDKEYWEYYLVYQYPFKKNKCLRLRFGHKIGQNLTSISHSETGSTVNKRTVISWSCAIQPWKEYRGG